MTITVELPRRDYSTAMDFFIAKCLYLSLIVHLCPGILMYLLVVIKSKSVTFSSPNVSYSCGNMYPWSYVSSSVDLKASLSVVSCLLKSQGLYFWHYHNCYIIHINIVLHIPHTHKYMFLCSNQFSSLSINSCLLKSQAWMTVDDDACA